MDTIIFENTQTEGSSYISLFIAICFIFAIFMNLNIMLS